MLSRELSSKRWVSLLTLTLLSEHPLIACHSFFLKPVMLIGGYRDALSFPSGQKITFNKEVFVASRPPPMQPFMEKMLQLQIFQQFIDGRLNMLHEGQGFNDEFEFELSLYEDRSAHNLKTQYKEWLSGIKKEGTAMLKSVNPAVRSCYRQVRTTSKHVKDVGKQAFRGIKFKMQEKPPHARPRSAPSSPTSSPRAARSALHHENSMKKSNSGFFSPSEYPDLNKQKMSQIPELNECKNRTGFHFSGFETADTFPPEADQTPQSFKPLVDLDLMGEMNEIMSKCSFGSAYGGYPTGLFDTSAASGNPFSPPPQTSSPSNTLFEIRSPTHNDLIKLESPPDDIAAYFDPLRAADQSSKQVSPKTNGVSSLKSPLPSNVSSSGKEPFKIRGPPMNSSLARNGEVARRGPKSAISSNLALLEQFAFASPHAPQFNLNNNNSSLVNNGNGFNNSSSFNTTESMLDGQPQSSFSSSSSSSSPVISMNTSNLNNHHKNLDTKISINSPFVTPPPSLPKNNPPDSNSKSNWQKFEW